MGAIMYKSCKHHYQGTIKPYQDCGYNDAEMERFFVLADGVRAYPKSGEASTQAVKEATGVLLERTRGKGNPKEWIYEAMQKANEAVYELNMVTDPQGKTFASNNAGTTLDIAVIHNGVLHVGHVGDGRVYVWSFKEGIKCVTKDHMYQGRLARVIGRSESPPDIDNFQMPLDGCKWVLLATDGIYKRVSEKELGGILKHNDNHKKALQELLNLAYYPVAIAEKRMEDFKITKEQAQLMLKQERDDMTGILIRCRGAKNG